MSNNNFKELSDNEEKCIDCRACHKVCPMMSSYDESPKNLLREIGKDENYSREVAYSCMLCNACTESCPLDIDLKSMFLNIRTETYNINKRQLPVKTKQGIKRVENHQIFSFSKVFSSNSSIKKAKSLFIPGCSLTNYSPSVLQNTFDYLKERLDNIDILVKCCGKPSMYIGDNQSFSKQVKSIQKIVDDNQIEQIIVACENCYNTYNNDLINVKVITLWEVIDKLGVPKELINNYNNEKTFTLHDPCSIKTENHLHDAIRSILKDIGADFIEFDHNREHSECCGSGGMVRETNRELWEKQRYSRANSTECENLISYCQCCVNSLSVSGKNTLHIIDLLFNETCIKGNMDSQNNKSFIAAWSNKCISAHCIK